MAVSACADTPGRWNRSCAYNRARFTGIPRDMWNFGGCGLPEGVLEMKLGRLLLMFVVGAVLLVPALAHAQDTVIGGTVRDNTGGVLPGVTVTATNEAAGTTFVAVTDEQGLYRIPVRPGLYRVTAELSGFATVARPGVDMLLGRQVTLNLEMGVSGVQETVTVTGEAP